MCYSWQECRTESDLLVWSISAAEQTPVRGSRPAGLFNAYQYAGSYSCTGRTRSLRRSCASSSYKVVMQNRFLGGYGPFSAKYVQFAC